MDRKFSITLVPQADELSKVILTVEAVFNDNKTDFQIADYVGFTDRQGRYYRAAGELLGLIQNTNNNAELTSLGNEVIVLDDENRIKKIKDLLVSNALFSEILKFIETKSTKEEIGATRTELIEFLLSIIDGADSTILRRFNTIINWLLSTSLIKLDIRELSETEKEPVFAFNEIIEDVEEPDLPQKEALDSIYPVNYTTEELDIKEGHMQVVSLLRKKEQKKILVPEFQRNQVWKQQQKSRFIESLILNIPVPPFYISQDFDGNMIIVDGLQRSTAIFEFFSGKYSLVGLEALHHLNSKFYLDLDNDIKARIEDRELLLYILRPSVPMTIVYDIFNRINSNGTPLTRQEIRNCIYIGNSTRLLARLAENDSFRKAIDNGIPSLRMKDREAILRFFAFTLFDYTIDYKNDLDDFLGKTMRRINRLDETQLKDLENRFIRVMVKTFDFFQYSNFRLPTEYGRGRINIALMETISVFFDKNSDEFLSINQNRIINNYYNILLKDNEFIDSVRISTSSDKNVRTRFNKTVEILSKV